MLCWIPVLVYYSSIGFLVRLNHFCNVQPLNVLQLSLTLFVLLWYFKYQSIRVSKLKFRALAPNHSLWRRANARNVSFGTLNGGQYTYSNQLIEPNYLIILIASLNHQSMSHLGSARPKFTFSDSPTAQMLQEEPTPRRKVCIGNVQDTHLSLVIPRS